MEPQGLVSIVASIAEPWRRLYAESSVVAIVVVFVHLAALVVAAGFALSADRATLRASRSPDGHERARHLGELARAHPVVVGALVVVMASGALLALSDVETYALASLFWWKMLLVALLLANGLLMRRREAALRRALAVDDGAAERRAWRGLRRAAVASGVLWMATVLAGTALSDM